MSSIIPVDVLLEAKIRATRTELKALRKQTENEDAIHSKENDLSEYLIKYTEVTGHSFSLSAEDQAREFCEDYYSDLDNDERSHLTLGRFYDKQNSSCLAIGYGSIVGRENIVNMMLVSELTHCIATCDCQLKYSCRFRPNTRD